MSAQASRRSTGVDVGKARRQRLLDRRPARAGSRGRAAAARRARAAASFICSYSSRRRTSSARGSSASSPSAVFFGGSSMRDLISISIAAISRYSAASSRLVLADLLDVGQVLARHARHRDVEDVEVLLADQVEQQVERAFEGLEEDLERVGRDVQVVRQREQRLAVQPGHRDLVDHLGHGDAGRRHRPRDVACAAGVVAGVACGGTAGHVHFTRVW